MQFTGEEKADPDLANAARHCLRRQRQVIAERLEDVGGATSRRRRHVAVLGNRHAGAGRDKRRRCRDIERVMAVTARSHDVHGIQVPEVNLDACLAHGGDRPGEDFRRDAAGIVLVQERGDLPFGHLPPHQRRHDAMGIRGRDVPVESTVSTTPLL